MGVERPKRPRYQDVLEEVGRSETPSSLELQILENLLCGSGSTGYIVASCTTALSKQFGIGCKLIHTSGKVVVAIDFDAAAILLQLLCLAESLVVRTEEDRHTPDGCLYDIVYAHAESTAYIRHLSIAIDAGE